MKSNYLYNKPRNIEWEYKKYVTTTKTTKKKLNDNDIDGKWYEDIKQILNKSIDWKQLSYNINAIPILEKIDKVDWLQLSANPNANPIIEKNLDKVHWWSLSTNPNYRR